MAKRKTSGKLGQPGGRTTRRRSGNPLPKVAGRKTYVTPSGQGRLEVRSIDAQERRANSPKPKGKSKSGRHAQKRKPGGWAPRGYGRR